MRIILYELKKVWNIKLLAVICAFFVIYSLLAANALIENYPRGTWLRDVDIAHHLSENYGRMLDIGDYEDFLKYEETIIQEVNEFISSRQVFADAGILDFDDFQAFQAEIGLLFDTLTDEELMQREIIRGEMGDIIRLRDGSIIHPNPHEPSMAFRKWIDFHNAVGKYSMNVLKDTEWASFIDNFITYNPLSERELRRAVEIRDSGEMVNIMPYETMRNTWENFMIFAYFIIPATLVLVSPLITTDRARKINWLQYSSKQGRGIFAKQFIAVIISAVLATTFFILIFACIYNSATGTAVFWDNGINSFLSNAYYWLSITFGQYCLLMTGIIYLLSVSAAVIAFILSRYSKNIVTLMIKLVPTAVVAIFFLVWILEGFLIVYYVEGNILIKMFSLAAVFIAGTGTALFIANKEKKIDII